jgi:NADPH-dependent 7-cyano-7-deazaguanine reductase QueF
VELNVIRANQVDEVRIEAEFSSICPLTKTVDRYELTLTYKPRNGVYLELQSFKDYLDSFKDKEIFHEDLAHTIAVSVCKEVKPEEVTVELKSVFVGLKITVVKRLKCPDS